MTPAEPTFISARDALLAVMQAQDPRDHDLCLQGFAKRGAGAGAAAPDSLSEDNAGVVESFKAAFDPGVKSVAVEYYHAVFDHYFITNDADGDRQARQWHVSRLDAYERVVQRVCRRPGRKLHRLPFLQHILRAQELAFLYGVGNGMRKSQAEPHWQFEGGRVHRAHADVAGLCPAGTLPVYRLYNDGQGAAPNHRFTTSLGTRAMMLAQGWLPEGNGIGVSMCSPT